MQNIVMSLNAYHEKKKKRRTHPTFIVSQTDVIPTRAVGSNVLVCTTGSLMIVNSWVQALLDTEIMMPNWMKFDLRNLETVHFVVERNQDCLVCGDRPMPKVETPNEEIKSETNDQSEEKDKEGNTDNSEVEPETNDKSEDNEHKNKENSQEIPSFQNTNNESTCKSNGDEEI